MKHYKLKLTALTPIHIGTGEVYEPTNFVVDGGYLYEFDEILFIKSLDEKKQRQFLSLVDAVTKNGYELFEKIHKFIIDNKINAKNVAHNVVRISKKFEKKYNSDIAKKVQNENKGNKSVFNKFEIQKIQKLNKNHIAYIPGSSIKGAISTAYQEMLFKKDKKLLDMFHKQKNFRNLSISDTLYNKSNLKVSFAKNIELFDDDGVTLETMLEVIEPNSEFLLTLSLKDLKDDNQKEIKEKVTKEKIIKACKEHYKVIYDEKVNKAINLKENQFIISIGKHSGARAVTIDGLRKILVKLCQIQNKKSEGNDADKRVERLYKKSHFESEVIKNLFADIDLLNEKELRKYNQAKHFIENPNKLEKLVRNREKLTISAILNQETTIWKFDDDNNLDSFGWLLCEFIDDDQFEKLSKEFKEHEDDLTQEKQTKISKIKKYIKSQELKKQEEIKQKELEKLRRQEEEENQKKQDFQKAKECENLEFLQIFVVKYKNDILDEDMKKYKDKIEQLQEQQKQNRLHELEQKAQKAFEEVKKKKGTKGFDKAKEKFIKKYSKEKENKGSKNILELVDKIKSI